MPTDTPKGYTKLARAIYDLVGRYELDTDDEAERRLREEYIAELERLLREKLEPLVGATIDAQAVCRETAQRDPKHSAARAREANRKCEAQLEQWRPL